MFASSCCICRAPAGRRRIEAAGGCPRGALMLPSAWPGHGKIGTTHPPLQPCTRPPPDRGPSRTRASGEILRHPFLRFANMSAPTTLHCNHARVPPGQSRGPSRPCTTFERFLNNNWHEIKTNLEQALAQGVSAESGLRMGGFRAHPKNGPNWL